MEWLNYHHLLYFWTVVREGGVSRAAEKLRLSQPTVSFHLKKLVQAGLLEREQRGVWAFYTVNREVLPRLGRIFELEGAIA